MNTAKIQQLTSLAEKYMEKTKDPVHDLGHVKRVVAYSENISREYDLTFDQRQALILAAWWHDVSRILTKKTSIFIMPCIDDTLSSIMLWLNTIKHSLFGEVVGISTRLLLCKSLGTGKILTKILLKKKDRILLDILNDADRIDMLSLERLEYIRSLVGTKYIYNLGYKASILYFLKTTQLYLKTQIAIDYLKQLIKILIEWFKNPNVTAWHIKTFGKKWTRKTNSRVEKFCRKLNLLTIAV